MASITYAKLRDGSWGVRAEGCTLMPGQTVTVSKKDGTRKIETINAVIWTDGKVTLATTSVTATPSTKAGRRKSNGLGPRTGCSCGSQEYGSKPTDCASCRFDQDDN